MRAVIKDTHRDAVPELRARLANLVRPPVRRLLWCLVAVSLMTSSCEEAQTTQEQAEHRSGARTPGTDGKNNCPRNANGDIRTTTKTTSRAREAKTKIHIDARRQQGPISPLLYGVNHRYPYNGFGMWNPQQNDVVPLFKERFAYAGFSAVRFPGGRTANNYHWRRAIGPVSKRIGHVDSAFGRSTIHGQTLTNEFGPDEFGSFLEQTEAQGSIVANFATATAQEVANWVEYMNTPVGDNPHGSTAWAKVRARNGHREPYNIKYWEIGNELAGAKTFWLGQSDDEKEKVTKYIFGGSTRFKRQRVGKRLDYSPSASVANGHPSPVFYARFPPVEPGSETVYVNNRAWTRVEDLDEAVAQNVYEFDPVKGQISFGNGEHGNIPPKGAEIRLSHVSGPHDGFVDFYREMKEVDPSIEIGAAYNSPLFMSLMGTTYPYDFVVAHSYSFFNEAPRGMRELHDLMMYLPEEQALKIEEKRDLIRAHAGLRASQIEIVVSEYAIATGKDTGLGQINAPRRYPQSLDGALYIASLLRHWIRLGVPLANKHSLLDIDPESPPPGYTKTKTAYQAVIGSPPCFLTSATAHVFRMFTSMTGNTKLASTIVANPTRRIFNGASLSSLAEVASRDDSGRLYVMVVNRDGSRSVPAQIRIRGFRPSSSARLWTLNGPHPQAYNTLAHPNRVDIDQTLLEGVGRGFGHTFPAHSITAIELEPAND
jgi:alpha-N-arabinofuranosidase